MEIEAPCDLVLPCHDEAGALPALLREVPPGFSVIVVDNGSRDGTADIARAHGALVVSEPRLGYGAAVQAGIEAATAEYVAVMDGDGSFDPAELPALLAAVATGSCEMALGRRRPVHDLAPIRVCRRLALLDLYVRDRRFGYPLELLGKATLAGWRLAEHDVAYRRRAAGTVSKVSGTLRGTVRTARDFWKVLSSMEAGA